MDANLKALQFVQVLSICTEERIQLSEMFDERMRYVAVRIGNDPCQPSIRHDLSERRSFFEQQIQQSSQKDINQTVYEMMKVKVDAAGNITDE